MTYVVVVADRVGDDGMELMRKAAELSVVTTVGHPERLTDAIAAAHALVVRSSTHVTDALMARSPD